MEDTSQMDHDGTTRAAVAKQKYGRIATKNFDGCGGVDALDGRHRGWQRLRMEESGIAEERDSSTVVALNHRRRGVQALRDDQGGVVEWARHAGCDHGFWLSREDQWRRVPKAKRGRVVRELEYSME